MGVAKAYSTRVGSGPFPTELNDATGEKLRQVGHEFGTTTGRSATLPGWLDLVALRYAVRVNGMTHLAITKLDVLDAFDELQISVGTGYKIGGEASCATSRATSPTRRDRGARLRKARRRWKAPTTSARSWSELPPQAIAYVARIEEVLRVPVALVSVGAERTATFSRLAIWEGL